MKIKFEWEEVDSDTSLRNFYVFTQRAKVPGGWLVRTVFSKNININTYEDIQIVQTFVSDQSHEWEI